MARSGPITVDTSTVALGLAQIRVGDAAANIASIAPVLTSSNSIGNLASTKYAGNVDLFKLESGFPLQEDLVIPTRETNALECAFREITPYNFALARGLSPFDNISATVTEITLDSTAGTTAGAITVTDTAGPTTETWTAVIEVESAGDTTYSVYGSTSGKVLDSVVDTSAGEPDNGGNPYFNIPIGFFDGTWVEGDTYVFATTAYITGTAAYGNAHSGSIGLGSLKAPEFLRMEAVYTYPDGVNKMTIIYPRCNVESSPELDLQAEDAAAITLNFSAKGASSDTSGGNAVWDAMSQGRIVWTNS